MKPLRLHFQALLKKINPTKERRRLARDLVGELRQWLQEHEFETADPHTLLIGSYARSTAVLWIKDVDVLVFLPKSALDRTPHAVLLELRKALADYPGAEVSAVGQRRSIRIEFEEHDFFLDIVPAVAPDGLDEPLKVPDRPKAEWIDSDPLGYMDRLSTLNQDHARKVVRLVKLIKAWRDAQMKIRRPKSYMLEVMVVTAVEDGKVTLDGESWPSVLAQLFAHWAAKWHDLMEEGDGVPRIYDPELGYLISDGWTRAEFETFMHRVREADQATRQALAAETEDAATEEWERVFGECWPTPEEVDKEAETEAAGVGPGISRIASSGLVLPGNAPRTISSPPTRYHGGSPRRRLPRFSSPEQPSQQIASMGSTFPQFHYRATRAGGLVWTGLMAPTPESDAYRIRVIHERASVPEVFVEDRELDPACKHLYPNGSICLYWPKEWRWKKGALLAQTLLPWTAFWLYYYELWETTGRWLGPSSPHGLRPAERN